MCIRDRLRAALIGILCICLIRTASADTNFWTEGTLEFRGHTVYMHAIVKDTLPSDLSQIKMEGKSIKKDELHQTLQKHFAMHPDFSLKHCQTVDDFYISAWAPGYSCLLYTSRCV